MLEDAEESRSFLKRKNRTGKITERCIVLC